MPRVKDFHGGEENFTSVSFMPIPNSVMQTLACLIIDGVMDRFPRLKFGAIELGASWVPELDAVHGSAPTPPSSRTRSGCIGCRRRPARSSAARCA